VEIFTLIALFLLGIVFAIIATIVGIGGGLLNVPALIFIFNVDEINATLISSFVIVFTSISGFLKYRQDKRIDYKTALIYLVLAIPGSILGGLVAERIDPLLLRRLFAILIGISAIRGIVKAYTSRNDEIYSPVHEDDDNTTKAEIEENRNEGSYRRIQDSEGDIYEYRIKLGIGTGFALLGGFLAGLLGVGGGIIFVPLLNTISGVPIHVAVATSTTMIVVVSVIAVITRFIQRASTGSLDILYIFSYGIPLALGSIVGAYIGAAKVKKIKAKQLTIFFWLVALFASVRMYLN